MQFTKGQTVTLEISALAFGGAGIGKHEGMVVFVEGAMPGDKVTASLTKIKKNFAEAKLLEILGESVDRVAPRCPYSGICGGCHFQFMKYEKQLEFKQQQVIDALERIGKIEKPEVLPIIGCKETFYFRNKMEFSFGTDVEGNFTLGMHIPGRRFDIMDLLECHLESLFSVKIVNAVREFMKEKNWAPFKYSNGEGFLKALFVREGKRTNEVMVVVSSSDRMPKDFESGVKELVEKLLKLSDPEKKIVSIYWSKVVSRRGAPKKIYDELLYGKKSLSEKMILENGDELSFEIFPQAFFQVNLFQAEILYSQVIKFTLEYGPKVIFDLFCGTGTIGLFLAKHVEKVLGVELNSDAVKSARENAGNNKIFNIDFFTGDVGNVLAKVNERPSLIVVDPPRTGLTKKLVKKISDLQAQQIVYVSCNPSTFARDLVLLKEFGYILKKVQPVDMFPHSYHIETVSVLTR